MPLELLPSPCLSVSLPPSRTESPQSSPQIRPNQVQRQPSLGSFLSTTSVLRGLLWAPTHTMFSLNASKLYSRCHAFYQASSSLQYTPGEKGLCLSNRAHLQFVPQRVKQVILTNPLADNNQILHSKKDSFHP